ncbi:MAG: hypothetical protein L0H64_10370 [Pseudonocardia sp.]|nr:hypothetical protein [Pseudonocardia sp.]
MRRLAAEGLVSSVPCRAGDVPSLVACAADVALLRVCPPDRHGNVSLGPSASYGRALIEGAAVVIGEVDESLPRTTGDDVTVHRSHFDHLVASTLAVELMGTERLFAVADGNPGISMVSSRRIHNPAWLARLPRFVSVCSALQVDLSGQVASESVGGVQVAGIGGSALDGPVTLARHAVDAVVTEFGVAHLTGRSVGERAEALTAIARPEHRAALNVG